MRVPGERFFAKIVNGFERDRHLSVGERILKGARLVSETAQARVALRGCTSVGAGARVLGRMRVENRGAMVIGSDFIAHSTFVPAELLTGSNGKLEIGDGVWVNFGAVIAAKELVKIGNRVHMGPHCIISDGAVPEAALDGGPQEAKPIEIGDDVWLAGRVTVMPGVRIGAKAVISAGSIVETDIPPGVVAGGIPARVLRNLDDVGEAARPAVPSDTGHSANNGVTPAPTVAVSSAASAAAPTRFGILVSDFTIDELAQELQSAADANPALGADVAPFGQVTQTLLTPPVAERSDFAVVWTQPEAVISSFARTMAFEEVDEQDLLTETDAFCQLIERAAQGYRFVFVPTWVLPPWARGLGVIDGRRGGATRALLTMNLRLMEKLSQIDNAYVLNAERWFETAGKASPKGWYLGKMPVPRVVMTEAAADIRAAVAGLTGGARKLLVVDLDDTLWGGVVGDVGWEELRLGGHDALGEAFVDFQKLLKNIKRRGIVLGIVSKNEEQVALEAIRRHPAMVLREDDFVGWKINWQDKAKNIVDLATQLNLGLQSVVFIDDNPVERARVREALPEVLVPDWPEDKLLYPSAFQSLRCFDTSAISREDVERTRMYADERKREQLKTEIGSLEEWLKGLDMRVRAERLGPANLVRAAQLLNKTNQLNLTTRRMTDAELLEWAQGSGRSLYTVSVSDRFGDAGLTGLVSVERDGESARIVDYVLSCRVMGRKVEEAMAHIAVTLAAEQAAARVVARYVPTAKNKPCLSFWQRSGFTSNGEQEFIWDTSQPYPAPHEISLEWQR
jgi:FkbH-like protein